MLFLFLPINSSVASAHPVVFLDCFQLLQNFFCKKSFLFLGILVAKKELFTEEIPTEAGGGTVFFVCSLFSNVFFTNIFYWMRKVSPERHQFLSDLKLKEEAGTPAIGNTCFLLFFLFYNFFSRVYSGWFGFSIAKVRWL